MKVILSIGLPGSGKSTVLKKLSSENNIPRISYDEIRQEFVEKFGDGFEFMSVIQEGKKRLLDEFKSNSKIIIIDATSAKKEDRKSTIEYVKSFDPEAEIIGLNFRIDPYEAGLRNSKRGFSGERFVHGSVINKMDKQFSENPPQKDEGFTEIFDIDASKPVEQVYLETSEKILS